jgi:DNA-binding IclR family transcriptional regulator
VFHRVDDFRALGSVRFYSLASRLPHYDGAVQHVLAAALAAEEQRPALRAVPDISPSTLEAISDHPGFPGIEYAGG